MNGLTGLPWWWGSAIWISVFHDKEKEKGKGKAWELFLFSPLRVVLFNRPKCFPLAFVATPSRARSHRRSGWPFAEFPKSTFDAKMTACQADFPALRARAQKERARKIPRAMRTPVVGGTAAASKPANARPLITHGFRDWTGAESRPEIARPSDGIAEAKKTNRRMRRNAQENRTHNRTRHKNGPYLGEN